MHLRIKGIILLYIEQTPCILHKRIACIFCHYKPKKSDLRHVSKQA
jgi:hypothetical protein